MTTRDPEWTRRDRELALAWQDEDRTICPGCGLSRLESTVRENQGAWRTEPFYCHGCAAMQSAQRHNRDNGVSDGLYMTLVERRRRG